jgi:hypothetical protein
MTNGRRIVSLAADALNANLDKVDEGDELARLRAENERLRAASAPRPVTFKISDKGGVSVYGMGRFPTTLYVEQWDRLLAQADELRAFIDQNRGRLRTKGET